MRTFPLLIIVAALLGPMGVQAQQPCTLIWDAPTTRVDGTPLAAGEITKYHIYVGTSAATLVKTGEVVGATSASCAAVGYDQSNYAAVTAVSASGESLKSNVLSPMPAAPTNLRRQ
jgi:fibronectin type 3 domain-containing protein